LLKRCRLGQTKPSKIEPTCKRNKSDFLIFSSSLFVNESPYQPYDNYSKDTHTHTHKKKIMSSTVSKAFALDLTKMTWSTFAFETASSLVFYSISDVTCQGIEGKLETEGMNCDRVIRGNVFNIASGGGPIGWMQGLWIDSMFPGRTFKMVLIKTSFDIFILAPITNTLFVYTYAYSQEGHAFAVQQLKNNAPSLVFWSIVIGIPCDLLIFSTSGWTREIVSDILCLVCNIVPSYYVNRRIKSPKEDDVNHVAPGVDVDPDQEVKEGKENHNKNPKKEDSSSRAMRRCCPFGFGSK